jgi:hypothetical protein
VPFHRVDNRIDAVRIGTALPVRDVRIAGFRIHAKKVHFNSSMPFNTSMTGAVLDHLAHKAAGRCR